MVSDVRGAIALLHRALSVAPPGSGETPYVLDALYQYYSSSGDFDTLRRVMDEYAGDVPQALEASFEAIASVIGATMGVAGARCRARDAIRRSLQQDAPLTAGRVLARAALTSYFLRDYDEAADRALQSALLLEEHGGYASAAASYSIAAAIAHADRRDCTLAAALYEKMFANADRAGNGALRRTALAGSLIVAAERYDLDTFDAARSALLADRAARQHQESPVITIAEALGHGWRGELATVDATLSALGTAEPGFMLVPALRSFISVARWDLDEGRRLTRAVIGQRFTPRDYPLHEVAGHADARIIAAFACFAMGDRVRAERALTKAVDPDGRYRELLTTESIDLDRCPELFRGYAQFINVALDRARELRPAHGLTATEVALVRALPHGHTVRELAEQLGKSKHTVARQLESIYAKLRARNRTQAIHQARERGLL